MKLNLNILYPGGVQADASSTLTWMRFMLLWNNAIIQSSKGNRLSLEEAPKAEGPGEAKVIEVPAPDEVSAVGE